MSSPHTTICSKFPLFTYPQLVTPALLWSAFRHIAFPQHPLVGSRCLFFLRGFHSSFSLHPSLERPLPSCPSRFPPLSKTARHPSIPNGRLNESIDQLSQLSIQALTTPLTTSPDSPVPSAKQHKLPSGSGPGSILAKLRNRRKGRPQRDQEWWCVRLSLDEFESFEKSIQADDDLNGLYKCFLSDLNFIWLA